MCHPTVVVVVIAVAVAIAVSHPPTLCPPLLNAAAAAAAVAPPSHLSIVAITCQLAIHPGHLYLCMSRASRASRVTRLHPPGVVSAGLPEIYQIFPTLLWPAGLIHCT